MMGQMDANSMYQMMGNMNMYTDPNLILLMQQQMMGMPGIKFLIFKILIKWA